MKVLVTGGAGYIGSHTCVELLEAGYEVVVLDNLSNSKTIALDRVAGICGSKPLFVEGDIRSVTDLEQVFSKHDIESVIHFAGLKAVGESVEKPLLYYQNNVQGTLTLIEAMEKAGVHNLVFSSSATVYGDPASVPIDESFPLSATNPYGRSKLMVEDILRDYALANPDWNVVLLRYFNPVGAHPSGLIGEDPNGIPNNLLPYVSMVAVGTLECLSVFGNDYPTPDGTGVRDYIHVVDLARGHLKALEKISALEEAQGIMTYNLGTGQGYSVLEMIRAFEAASQRQVAYRIVARRAGDVASCYADPGRARDELNWVAEKSLDDMVRDAWNWQRRNPRGFE